MTHEQMVTKYYNSYPKEVRALRFMAPGSPERYERVRQLLLAGYRLDPQIHDGGADPIIVHRLRAAAGLAWVPALTLEGAVIPPGIFFQTAPPGAIATLSRVTRRQDLPVADADPSDGPTISVGVAVEFDDSAFETLPPYPDGGAHGDWVDIHRPVEGWVNGYAPTLEGVKVLQDPASGVGPGHLRSEDGATFECVSNPGHVPPWVWVKM